MSSILTLLFYSKASKQFIIKTVPICLILLIYTTTVEAATIFYANFENQDFHGMPETSLCCSHSAVIVKSPVRSGNYAVKFTLNSDDAGTLYGKWYDLVPRAELVKNGASHVGDIRWYGFSMYIDPSWQDDTNDPNGTIVTQWHSNGDPGETTNKSPHLSIAIKGDNWTINNFSDPNLITTRSPDSFKRIKWDLGRVTKGKWVDWVIYAKWSFQSSGVLKIWKDGDLVVNHLGPNTYNDTTKEIFKFGIYKAWWKHELPPRRNTFILYYDGVRIDDGNSSYDEISPKRLAPFRPPSLAIKNNE